MAHQTSKTFLTDAEKARIDEAVRRAEIKTSGEIVPVLATSAEPYDRGLFYAALMSALVATLSAFAILFMPLEFLYNVEAPWVLPSYFFAIQLVALFGGYHAARFVPGIHRAFISRAHMQRRVDRAARQAFRLFQLTHTKEATGIMIYVSLFERAVVVLADKAIDRKHDKHTWDDVRDLLIDGLRKGNAVDGFERAIAECGRILEKDFPIKPDDVNELPNHIRLM
jgi:putative membrane protein